jgi:hypothetical protein
VPLAPSTSTTSSSRTGARHDTASQPVTPAIPHAAATASSTPSGTSTARVVSTTARSATVAAPRNHTRRPSRTPIPSDPIT